MSKIAVAKDSSELPETKVRLLDAAIGLMLKQGFTATTVDQICAEAELTKGSFFHYFKSKEDIGEAALDRFCQGQQERFLSAKFSQLPDPLDRLHGLLDFMTGNISGMESAPSCLMGNFAQELSETNPRLRERCAGKFEKFGGYIEQMLREAQVKHPAKTKFDPAGVAMMFVALLQGSMLVAKARQDKSLMLANLKYFRGYVDMLFARTKS